MSASNPQISKIIEAFNKLSYEPVLDSESSVKAWINSHNSGVFSPFINGLFVTPTQEQLNSVISVKNPYNGGQLAKVVNCDKGEYDQAVDSGVSSISGWKQLTFLERGKIVYNIARNVQKHLTILTACESVTSGRTSREVKDLDITNIIRVLYHYAGAVSLDDENYEPVGQVAILGYVDSSLLSLVNKLAIALVTGNTCLVVPHKDTPLSAYMFLDICIQSGVPAGVINLICSDKADLIKWISADARINAVSFDGRLQKAQELIMESSLLPSKRVLLSLEGKSSLVIYDSADFDSAIETIVDGAFYSNGQHRHSLNKVFIQENVYDDVLHRLEARFAKLRAGNHLDKCNDYSTMINPDDSANLKSLISNQVTEFGAKVKRFENCAKDVSPSNPISVPTLIENVSLNSQLNINEVNGPYLLLMKFRTVKESIELINTSKFGAGVCLYSQNISLVMEVAYLLNAGTVWINSIPIERGVQLRKQSGNFQTTGFRSLRNFLRPKWEKKIVNGESGTSPEQFAKAIKSFGSLDTALPPATGLQVEETYKLYIGGKQARPDTQSSRSVFKHSKELYCLVPDSSRKDVRNAVEAAQSAFGSWCKRSNFNKSQIIYYFGENLAKRAGELAKKLELITGKSSADCEREVKLCQDAIFHFASSCDKQVGKLNDTTDYGYSLEAKEPIGSIGIVCGHNASNDNYPLLTFVLHLTGAIANGNTVIIVPDEHMPIPALDLYEIFETSDMPPGVVNILTGNKHHLAKHLSEHQNLNALWYLYDLDAKSEIRNEEHIALQFLKYTGNFNLKQTWIVPNLNKQSVEHCLSKGHLNELDFNATQTKSIHVPMGTIFSN